MTKKAGFAAIIGKPNAGKSTLLNAVLGQELSIVTSKPQTTRNKIFGIYTKENYQIVFVDTPGILEPKYKLHAFMKKEIESSFIEADMILLLIDTDKYHSSEVEEICDYYKKEFEEKKTIAVLNKIDLITKEEVLMIIKDISDKFKFNEIVPISARKKFNVDELVKVIKTFLPESEFYFDEDIITSQPEKFFAAEIIRECALKLFKEEIPFSIYVDIEEFKERERGKDFIRASVVVEKDSQKAIVIGSGGVMIKKLGEFSRMRIEELLGKQVYLDLNVKVKKDWKNDEKYIRNKFKSLTEAGG